MQQVTIANVATMQLLEFYEWDMLLIFTHTLPVASAVSAITHTSLLHHSKKGNVTGVLIVSSSGILTHVQALVSSIYLDRKCIVLPARCGAGSCSIFPFSTCPLISTTVQLSRRFVLVWHIPSRNQGKLRDRIHPVFSCGDNWLPASQQRWLTGSVPQCLHSDTHPCLSVSLTHTFPKGGREGGDVQEREARIERQHPKFHFHRPRFTDREQLRFCQKKEVSAFSRRISMQSSNSIKAICRRHFHTLKSLITRRHSPLTPLTQHFGKEDMVMHWTLPSIIMGDKNFLYLPLSISEEANSSAATY